MNVMGGSPMTDTLYEGGTLTMNQAISSRNGMFRAVMQADNNFVVYKSQMAIWDSKTCNRNGNNGRLVLQVGKVFLISWMFLL